MPADLPPSGEFADAPHTGKIVRETKDELDNVADRLGVVRSIMGAGIAVAIAVFGFTAFMLTTYAKSSDVKELKAGVEAKLENHSARLERLEASTESRLARLEARQERVDAQLWEIAKATGARLVVSPPPVVVTQPAPVEAPKKERR